MNKYVALGLLLTAATAGLVAYEVFNKTSSDDIPIISKDDMSETEQRLWQQWQVDNNKKFSSKDIDYRMSVFHYNYQKIKTSTSKNFQRGLNQFMDLTESEFAQFYLGYRPELKKKNTQRLVASDVESTPASVDWRTATNPRVVTDIKNQQQCGSCWAFSTTGSVEGLYAQTQGASKEFSEQQLVDCSSSYGNQGCNGGLMDNGFKYVEAKGLETESQYPYEAVDGTCVYQAAGDFKIGSYKDVGGWFGASSADLKAAIAIRPVSIAVDAQKWSSYTGGIYDDCGTSLDHGVLAVGYTADYWIVKNSWGSSWGEEGYIRLKMGNTCGLLNQASYPTA